MEEQLKRKNVLDLQFQKYLTIASTSILIAFTYTKIADAEMNAILGIQKSQAKRKDFLILSE